MQINVTALREVALERKQRMAGVTIPADREGQWWRELENLSEVRNEILRMLEEDKTRRGKFFIISSIKEMLSEVSVADVRRFVEWVEKTTDYD